MVDTPTKVSDIIVPEIYLPAMQEATTRSNAFFQSGVVQTVDDLTFPDQGGKLVEMPFFKALGERAQLLDDTQDLEIKKIEMGQDTAVLHARALVYGASDLSSALNSRDPMLAIANGVGENWSYEFNMVLISTIKGAMNALAAESPAANTLDISGLSGAAAYIDGEAFIDAGQTMGDAKSRIVACAMHSATEAYLQKNDLIAEVRDSDGVWLYNTFQQKRVIVDDALAPSNGIYETYLFGPGAIGYDDGAPKVPFEEGRDPLIGGGQDYIVSRRHFVLHPRGIRWTPQSGDPAKLTPTDAELEIAGNWTRAYQTKNIRIVRMRHKLG
ncbi:major capsid protein [Microbaculum marinum]|uniref:Major capsid protein n=1 Tax=Microbaculum marinum TaxID=1764581 RepID=A0AAW9RQL7_9HYPH